MTAYTFRAVFQHRENGNTDEQDITVTAGTLNSGFRKAAASAVANLGERYKWEIVSLTFWIAS